MTEEIDAPTTDDAQWNECPRGTLANYSSLQNSRVFRRRLLLAASGLAAVGMLATALLMLPERPEPPPSYPRYGGLSCREVVDSVNAFFAQEVPSDYRGRILQHLVDCPNCKRLYEQRGAEVGVSVALQPLEPWSPQPWSPEPWNSQAGSGSIAQRASLAQGRLLAALSEH